MLAKDNVIVSSASLHIFVPSLLSQNNTDPFQVVNNNEAQSNEEDEEEEVWTDVHYIKWNRKNQKAFLVQTDVVRNKVSKKYGGWIKLDIMEIVDGVWLKNPNQNMGLHIQANTKSGQAISVGVQYQTINVSKFVNNQKNYVF